MKNKIISIIFVIAFMMILFQVKVSANTILSTDKEVNSGDGNVTITITSTKPLGAYTLDLADSAGLEVVSASGVQVSPDNRKITGSSAEGITVLGSFTFKIPTVTQDTTYNINFHAYNMEDCTDEMNPIDAETNTAVLIVRAVTQTTDVPTTTTDEPNTNNENNGNNNNSNNNNNTSTPTTTEKSDEARLKNLGIKPNDFSGFNRNTYEYNVEVPNDVTSVEVYAEKVNSKATIKSGTGNVKLNEGTNKVEVIVVAEDGETTKTYKLNITRKTEEEPETESTEPTTDTTETTTETTIEKEFGLDSLTIAGLNLNPKFSTTTYEYTAGLTADLTTLEIKAEANQETATVEIYGNENLQQGENIITIMVVDSEDTEKNATYQITINKNVITESVGKVDWLKPSTWQLKQYIIIGTLTVLIIIVIVAIILKIKLSNIDEDDYIDFPGVEELDKALIEHQELTSNEEKDASIANRRQKVKKLFEEKDEEMNELDTKEKVNQLFDSDEENTKKKGKHF